MKKTLLISLFSLALAFVVAPSFAQIRKIPGEVTDALKAKYPEASNVTWKDKLSAFAADFELNGSKYQARFSNKGEWQSTEKEISEDDLPGEVKDGLQKSKYADWQFKSAYNIDLPDDKLQFRIQVAKSDLQKKNLLFSKDGQLLRDNITL